MTVYNKEGGNKKIVVTLPVSDTVPGPGNYTVEVLNMNGTGIPVVDATDLTDSPGAGTAQDISSTEQAPEILKADYINTPEARDEQR